MSLASKKWSSLKRGAFLVFFLKVSQLIRKNDRNLLYHSIEKREGFNLVFFVLESASLDREMYVFLGEEGYLWDEEGGFLLTFVFDEECNFPFLISFLKLAVVGPT